MKSRFVSYFLHINQCKLREALRRPASVHLPPVSEPASGAAGASSARVCSGSAADCAACSSAISSSVGFRRNSMMPTGSVWG